MEDPDAIGQTPLHYAVCHRFALELTKVLLDRDANPNPVRKSDGWTPLHLAAMFGKVEVIQLLLESGADSDIKDKSGKTPEDVAKQFKNYQIADLLHRYVQNQVKH